MVKESGATRKRLTPFAADSGFAASGYAPRASKGFGMRRCLARPAAAAKTNRWHAPCITKDLKTLSLRDIIGL